MPSQQNRAQVSLDGTIYPKRQLESYTPLFAGDFTNTDLAVFTANVFFSILL